MDNTRQKADNNLRKNLGKTLIEWIKVINERRLDRYNGTINSFKNKQYPGQQYTDLISIKIKNSDPVRNRKRNFYRE